MPQTTPERAARWPGMDSEAMEYLAKQGYKLRKDWFWEKPTEHHNISEKEEDAILYLIQEWDFGGVIPPPLVCNRASFPGRTSKIDAVYIGRGSIAGNPFVIGKDGTRDEVCDKFEAMVEANSDLKKKLIKYCSGKDLICFCAPKRCHGDYLLRISNTYVKLS